MKHRNYGRGSCSDNGDNPSSRIFFGVIVALVGFAFLLKSFGIFPFYFKMSWPYVLIVIGVLIGLKNGFRKNAWWILIVIGTAHAIPVFEIMGRSSKVIVWPIILMIAGLMIAFRPKPKRNQLCNPVLNRPVGVSSEDVLMVDVAFGGRKEIITAKDFKGGRINVAFGGSEVNLINADFSTDSIVVDCKVAFGGIEFVIPSNWDVQNEIRPTFGAVDDERIVQAGNSGEVRKKLILTGNCTFGGIELKSY